ncbi:MAG TPA: NUDIX domain-containing protein [Candidatus Magasanikbacteria bacterium]|nr:NUDIX domain-containing protein [Candidatus Magasanikbacteria bacterium]
MAGLNNEIEILDIVDATDTVIGSATRDEVYEKLLPHRIVHVLIFNDKNEMALQLRSNTVSFCPSHWSTAVGGHVQTGENYESAAMREYEEELGMKNTLTFFDKDIYEVEDKPKKFLTIFTSRYNGPFSKDPTAVEKVEFFPLDTIRTMIRDGEKFHPELLFLLQKHFVN